MTQARSLALIATLALAALALYGDVPRTFGAHPWWSTQVIWIGVPIGLALAGLVTWRAPLSWLPIVILVALTLAAFAIGADGKSRFAASYAENVLAGRVWYFGWIATCTLCAATVFAATHAVVAVFRADTT